MIDSKALHALIMSREPDLASHDPQVHKEVYERIYMQMALTMGAFLSMTLGLYGEESYTSTLDQVSTLMDQVARSVAKRAEDTLPALTQRVN